MKFLIIIMPLFFQSQLAAGQNGNLDSLTKRNNELLAKCFDGFEDINHMDTSGIWSNKICNLLSIAYLDLSTDSIFHEFVFLRLEQIAIKHYEEGNPIYIVGSGMNSFEKAIEQNNEDRTSDLIYLSFGNSCVSTDLFQEGIEHVNRTTMRLMNKEKRSTTKNKLKSALILLR